MTLIDDIVSWGKNQLIYMTGRGLVGSGMLIAAWMFGIGAGGTLGTTATLGLMIAAVAGTAAVQGFITYRNEKRAERGLVRAYREEVAALLGMNPKDVTIENLRDAAIAQPDIDLPGNPVLKEALDRVAMKHMMQFVTSGLSALATLGLAIGTLFLFDFNISNEFTEFRDNALSGLNAGWLAQTSIIAGSMFVAGTGMGMLNKVFDFVGERVLNIHKDGAHDLIMDIRRDITRGKMIVPEQVFGVYVAAQPELAAQIEQAYGKAYEKLNQRQQHLAMEDFSDGMPTRRLAYELNHYMIEPEELAFAAVGQSSGVPKKRDVDFREEALREKSRGELVEEVKRAVTGADEGKNPPREPPANTAAANDNQDGFADRFVPRDARVQKTFVERYAPDHAKSQLDRMLVELRERQNSIGDVER